MRDTLRGIFLILTLRCAEADLIRLRRRHNAAGRLERVAEVLHRVMCGSCRRAAVQAHKLDAVLEAQHERHI